jgi:hypothetical protein
MILSGTGCCTEEPDGNEATKPSIAGMEAGPSPEKTVLSRES